MLPDDVTILTDTSQTSKAAVNAFDALTAEVSSLATSLSQVMRTRPTDMGTVTDSSGCRRSKEEQVQIVRRELERKRAQGPGSVAAVSVNTGDVRRLWDGLIEEQLQTDKAINAYVSLN